MQFVATYLADRQAVDMLWFYLGYEPWHVLVFERAVFLGRRRALFGRTGGGATEDVASVSSHLDAQGDDDSQSTGGAGTHSSRVGSIRRRDDLHPTAWLSCSTRFPLTIKPPRAWRCGAAAVWTR